MNLRIVKTCLENICIAAVEHPCFDMALFDTKNVKELCEIGGDICDWTTIAIEAQEALNEMEMLK